MTAAKCDIMVVYHYYQTGWGRGGVNRRGGLIAKKRLPKGGGLIREGGLNSEVGFNRDFTVKQQPD